ncbi:MAG: hypothetical protein R3F46_02950 [bacterium]
MHSGVRAPRGGRMLVLIALTMTTLWLLAMLPAATVQQERF